MQWMLGPVALHWPWTPQSRDEQRLHGVESLALTDIMTRYSSMDNAFADATAVTGLGLQ